MRRSASRAGDQVISRWIAGSAALSRSRPIHALPAGRNLFAPWRSLSSDGGGDALALGRNSDGSALGMGRQDVQGHSLMTGSPYPHFHTIGRRSGRVLS